MPGEVVADEAFVSLVTNNSYANGALVLGYSLRRVNTTRKLVLLVAKEVLEPTRQRLARVWDHLEIVDVLDSGDAVNLALLSRPELGITFTKIHCWNLTQYRKCVFLDADTLVVQNCDELFERDELSAVPDIGWPDCFNSGVFVFEPSRATYEAILEYAVQNGSFDGGDQGLLNSFFSNWRTEDISRHLSFIYNMNSNASYTYAPAFQQFGRDVKIVHFIGPLKPWHHTYNSETGTVYTPSGSQGNVPHERTFLQLWWDIYVTFVRPEMRQCHGGQGGDSSCSDHFQPAPHFPPQHHFEHTPLPHQFEHEPFIPPPPQHYETPHHPQPPSQHHESPHHSPQENHPQPPPPPPHSWPTETSQGYQDVPAFKHVVEGLADGVSDIYISDHVDWDSNPELQEITHQQAWERGEIDYRGRDKFENIQKKIEESIDMLRNPSEAPMVLF